MLQQLRELTGVGPDEYTIGDVTYWTDDQLTEVLARYSIQVVDGACQEINPAQWQVLSSGQFDSEAAFTIEDSADEEIEAEGISIDGVVSFAEDQNGPLYYTGLVYDLHGAAAYVLYAQAGYLSKAYDVEMDGQSLKRSQMRDSVMARAEEEANQALGQGSLASIQTTSEW